MNNILKNAELTNSLSHNEIKNLLNVSTFDKDIFNLADKLRHEHVGDGIYLRGLIEFSNICKCNCKYCGLRAENINLERYKLSVEEILKAVKLAKQYNFKTIVLQSGESRSYKHEELIKIIKEIKSLDIALTLSIGEKSFEEYSDYKKAGADRYLLRIETTDELLYKNMHPDMSFKNRVECLYNLKKLGYEVGTGSLIGLPEQTVNSIADDILFFKELSADMVGIGPFIPNEDTPLKNSVTGDFNLALKVMAITRILLPDINIPATTAMETLVENGRIIALKSGANVVMPNVSEFECCKNYKIYPKQFSNVNNQEYLNNLKEKFEEIGRFVDVDKGVSRHFLNK